MNKLPGIINAFLSVFCLITLASCDCMLSFSGTITDEKTDMPVRGAKVHLTRHPEVNAISDENGMYKMDYIEHGPLCYLSGNKKLVVERENYKTKTFKSRHKNIKLNPLVINSNVSVTCDLPDSLNGQKIYTVPETKATFPGGEAALLGYFTKNIHYPDNLSDIQSSVYVSFIIDPSGEIQQECIYKTYSKNGISPIEEEALKVIRKMPKWKPAFQDGKPVYSKFTIPIKICARN